LKRALPISILAISAIIIALILTSTFLNRNKPDQIIHVTGLGSKNFKSDLIVWSGSFNRKEMELAEAYDQIKKDREIIREYLTNKGVQETEIAFSSVSISKENKSIYDEDGDYQGTEFTGYKLTQSLSIESERVDEIDQLSRDITEIINEGVEFYSYSPSYYYTKLAELKIEMVAAATEDARVRAEQIAFNSDAELGNLKKAQMGVFQIIAQNSNDDYSWGGSFNTTSKMKTATITMRLQFGID
jgi:hypothetical protein